MSGHDWIDALKLLPTARDLFAAAALHAILRNMDWEDFKDMNDGRGDIITGSSFEFANAMMKRRED